MTEEQKEKKKAYMRKYAIDHKEQLKENRKKWYNNHKEQQLEANRKIYQKNKEKGQTWFQRNKDKVNEYNRQYRLKKIEQLKAQGIKNPWMVLLNKGEARYESNK